MKKKIALIVGISGQDGSLLAKFLLSKNYVVYGTSRFKSLKNLKKLKIIKKIKIFQLNTHAYNNLDKIIKKTRCDEIYYLFGQSSVKLSEKLSYEAISSNNLPLVDILEYVRKAKKKIKVFNTSSAEIFGKFGKKRCNENSNFDPQSFYALSKLISLKIMQSYRQQFKIWSSNGIMFNHESTLRNNKFIIKKIITSVKKIHEKKQKKLIVGDINISRDWGWAAEYVKAMWKILNYKKPDDFIIATGNNNKLKNIIKKVFSYYGLNYLKYVVRSKKYFRNNEVRITQADISKAKKLINWKPKIDIDLLLKKMIKNEI